MCGEEAKEGEGVWGRGEGRGSGAGWRRERLCKGTKQEVEMNMM